MDAIVQAIYISPEGDMNPQRIKDQNGRNHVIKPGVPFKCRQDFFDFWTQTNVPDNERRAPWKGLSLYTPPTPPSPPVEPVVRVARPAPVAPSQD